MPKIRSRLIPVRTYFAMFSLPRKLTIDMAALERDFYKLSRRLHPDLYARKSAEEQAWSLRQSSLLNDAYRTLKEPVARTAYLLKLEGMRIEDENSETRDLQSETEPCSGRSAGRGLRVEYATRRDAGEPEDGRGRSRRCAAIWSAPRCSSKGCWRLSMKICVAPGPHGTLHWMRTIAATKDKQKDAMVALLDRRSYLAKSIA